MENEVAGSVQWMTRGQGQDRENNIGPHIHTLPPQPTARNWCLITSVEPIAKEEPAMGFVMIP